MPIDSAIVALLPNHKSASISSHGGGGFASTSRVIVTLADDSQISFFLKTGTGDGAAVMFEGEHASLKALSTVANLAPRSLGHGSLVDGANKHFLLTEWLEMSGRGHRQSLVPKLAKLHTTPAPIPEGFTTAQFGFPVPTCCGSTPQQNDFRESWAQFYAENRMKFISERSRASNGTDHALDDLIGRICDQVVPRLLGSLDIKPVVVHGDLWSGNASSGRLPGMPKAEEVIFDSSACYAHSEYELGIMKMFGGFGTTFLEDYHKLVPKDDPIEEYDDRISLYELFHHLNHYAMFGGSYKSGAINIMRDLLRKYGKKTDG